MNYRDILREMRLSGHYSEADDLERSMGHHYISEYDRVYSRSDARDGLSIMSYSGDMAERAFDDIKSAERLEERLREEEERRRQHEADLRRQAERQQEEEYWRLQQQEVAPEEPQDETL